jgi:hypothetical protein
VIQAMGGDNLLIEDEPEDWYVDETGVFHEHGQEKANVQDVIYVQNCTLIGFFTDTVD